jgi:hypothetical protein
MTLTSDELTDLRGDIGDTGDVQAFTDAALQRLYVRAGSYAGAKALAFKQLLSNAAKFVRYTAGETTEAREQIFTHLKTLAAMADQEAGTGYSSIETGAADLLIDQDTSTTLSSRIDDDTEWEG